MDPGGPAGPIGPAGPAGPGTRTTPGKYPGKVCLVFFSLERFSTAIGNI